MISHKTDLTETPAERPVRVWVGHALNIYRHSDKREKYCELLGNTFIPATVQLMQPWQLVAYLPCIIPLDDATDAPDEVALVFYQSTNAYHAAATQSVGGRAYEQLHQTLFNFNSKNGPASQSGFPIMFTANAFEQSTNIYFYLYNVQHNWQQGISRLRVYLYEGLDTQSFRQQTGLWAASQQETPTPYTDIIFYLSGRLLVIWTNATHNIAFTNWPNSLSRTRMLVDAASKPTPVPLDVTQGYAGINTMPGDLLSLQFDILSTATHNLKASDNP